MNLQTLRFILFSRLRWRLLIVFITLAGTLFGLFAPYFQKLFIDRLLNIQTTSVSGSLFHLFETQIPLWGLLFGAFLCLLLFQGAGFLANYLGLKEALVLQGQLSEKLYDKALKLRPDSLKGKPIGEIVSLYTTDIAGATIFIEQSLPIGASTLLPLLLAPLALSTFFKIPMGHVLITIGALVLLNAFLAARQARFFMRFKQLAADRLGVVNEWIVNIKLLKLLGWVPHYENKIQKLRIEETKNRVAMVTNGQTMNALATTITFVINALALYTLIAHRGEGRISPGDLLSLLWIIAVFLMRPFRQLPWLFTYTFDGWTSLKRISHFFALQNDGRDWSHHDSSGDFMIETMGPSIEIRNLNLTIGSEKRLNGIHLNIKQKEFVALVGEVGSGKSLLLLSLIGETGADMDTYRINHRNMLNTNQNDLCRYFSFIPQDGFVMSASLRENIAFDYGVSPKTDTRVTEALSLAQFQLDPQLFPDHLDTEIGERGVNLSGGQKQRVNIARAHYYNSPIILMDDSLSALDVNTEKELVLKMLKDQWKNKTRILATHRLSVLKEVDRIFYLQDGHILAEGTLNQLLADCPPFREFVKTMDGPTPDETRWQTPVAEDSLLTPNQDHSTSFDGDQNE